MYKSGLIAMSTVRTITLNLVHPLTQYVLNFQLGYKKFVLKTFIIGKGKTFNEIFWHTRTARTP